MAKRKSIYGVHPAVAMIQKWVADLKDKTGKSLDEWMKFIKKNGPETEAERRAWLKATQGLGANSAVWLAERSVGKGGNEDSPESYLQAADKYVEAMFAGKKAPLKPIFDELLTLGLSLAKDVKACPCTTIVPFYRNHVFAQINPATLKRIDMGFALKDTKAKGRLIDTGGFAKKDRVTHRIPIASLAEIDDEVRHWFQIAYEMDGKE